MSRILVILASVVILFIFVAHDALMTVGDHGAFPSVLAKPSPPHVDEDAANRPLLSADNGLLPFDHPSQASDCAVTRSARPPLVDRIDLASVIVPNAWASAELTSSQIFSPRVDPGYPPDVRRALLQIYRN